MTIKLRLCVVVMALVMSSACEQRVRTTVSPSPVAVVSVSGTITATPGNTLLGGSVNVSWVAGSAVRVDVCNVQCTTLTTAPSSGQTMDKPPTSGEWRYKLFGIAAEPDVSVLLAETTVTVVTP